MEEPREEFVRLPVLYDHWPQLRTDLKALASKEISGADALEEVLQRNDRWENIHLPLTLLKGVLDDGKIFTEDHFYGVHLPWMAQKALQVEDLFQESEYKLKNLYTGREGEVMLTRHQVCCILCLAFFNSFEPQPGNYQQLTFAGFLSFAMYSSQRSKLICLLQYFEHVRHSEETGEEEFLNMCVSVSRRKLDPEDAKAAQWSACDKPLLPFEPLEEGLIESAHECLQVDFANAYIGGGVLGMGNVQEEIRFVINPECLVSILFCEEMDELESILITGAEQFSSYTGYGGRFKYTAPYKDTNPVDKSRRRCVSIVAIDAIPFMYAGDNSQFKKQGILRELNKAFCGFSTMVTSDDTNTQTLTPVATGNWGCGAFGGNKQLKTLIQWMSASRAGREVKYYSFKETDLSQEQAKITTKLLSKHVTVSQLYQTLIANSDVKDSFDYVNNVL